MDEAKIKKGISLEKYEEENKELLMKEFASLNKEDFIKVEARNPEDPNEIIELTLHKDQVEQIEEYSIEFNIPKEEMAYIIVANGIQSSENITVEERQQLKGFLNRQMKRIENLLKDKISDDLKGISIRRIKNQLIELYSIPMRELDINENSWRKQFKKENSGYKDVDTFVKVNFVSMLKSLGEEEAQEPSQLGFEEYLEKAKPELRKLKDTDFESITIDSPFATDIEYAIDEISQKHEMDRMETIAASMSYGREAIEKIIKKKGIEYTKCLIEDFMAANKKGDFVKMRILLDRMRKDAM